jgi:threonine dehydratase
MMLPTADDIARARERLRGLVHRTPLERSAWLSALAGCEVHLKLECWQRTRSFKVRGALNALAALGLTEIRRRGVVTASAGNHGQGVALAANRLGVQATIFVPETAPATKQARILAHGGKLHRAGQVYDEAELAARLFAECTGAVFVHPFSDPDVVAGQATVGAEIVEDLPEVREVIVPVGGGGLIAGIGAAVRAAGKGGIEVVGVQSELTRAMYAAFEAGRVVPTPMPPTLADGLAGGVEAGSYASARAVTSRLCLVAEADIETAIRELFAREGIVAEGAGAVGGAGLLSGRASINGPAVVVISGGNIDGPELARILACPG